MSERHEQHLQRIVEAVLNTAGDTQPSLRRAVEARSAELGGRILAGGLRGWAITDLRSAHNAAAGSSTTHLSASENRQYGRPELPPSTERLELPAISRVHEWVHGREGSKRWRVSAGREGSRSWLRRSARPGGAYRP